MTAQTFESRVEQLEVRVAKLEQLPERIDGLASQIVQLRTEMHDEFSAVRTEMHDEFSAVRTEMHDELSAVRTEMRDEFSAVRDEIRLGDEETRRYMRVLHEEVISRIATIQEGQDARRPREDGTSSLTSAASADPRYGGQRVG